MSVLGWTGGPRASGAGALSFVSRYGFGALLAGLAFLISLKVEPHWSPAHLLLPFYPVVILSAWFGGLGAGLFTMLLSAVAVAFFHLDHRLGNQDPWDLVGIILFLSVGLLINALNARVSAAESLAESSARKLEREVEERRTVEAVSARLATIADELGIEVERYRQQIERLGGVFRARRDGRIVECSDRFARLVGVASSEQVRARSMNDFFLEPAGWQELTASLEPGGLVFSRELHWGREDGMPLTVLASLRETGGLVEGIVVDVTNSRMEPAQAEAVRTGRTK